MLGPSPFSRRSSALQAHPSCSKLRRIRPHDPFRCRCERFHQRSKRGDGVRPPMDSYRSCGISQFFSAKELSKNYENRKRNDTPRHSDVQLVGTQESLKEVGQSVHFDASWFAALIFRYATKLMLLRPCRKVKEGRCRVI